MEDEISAFVNLSPMHFRSYVTISNEYKSPSRRRCAASSRGTRGRARGVPGACQGRALKAVEREEGNQGTISSDSASMELESVTGHPGKKPGLDLFEMSFLN